MSLSLTSVSQKSGLEPGTLVHVGEVHEQEQSISVISFNEIRMEKIHVNSIEELVPYKTTDTITWVIINGLSDTSIIDAIGKYFDINYLVLEDILNTNQRPKFEEFDDYLFIVFKSIHVIQNDLTTTGKKNQRKSSLRRSKFKIKYEQISLLVLDKFIFTITEKHVAHLDSIISRLENNKSQVRSLGADYLAYVILDAVVDEYFSLPDIFDELMDSIESELLSQPSNDTLMLIQKVKRELIFLRRSVSPMRELLSALLRSDSKFLERRMKNYFSDVYDHVTRITEGIDTYRDLITGMLDIYLSSVNNRMNETMKVLTIFTAIFSPLTFLCGVYGMNFDYMPELKWHWGYPAIWCLFVIIPLIMIGFFKKNKWM